jgi:hypothetical protein
MTGSVAAWGGSHLMLMPPVCAVCHGHPDVTLKLHKSLSTTYGNTTTTTTWQVPVRLCDECARRAAMVRVLGGAVVLTCFALAFVVVHALLGHAFEPTIVWGRVIAAFFGGALLGFGIGDWLREMLLNAHDSVRQALALDVGHDSLAVVFRDKALAIAFVRLNLPMLRLGGVRIGESVPVLGSIASSTADELEKQLSEWSEDIECRQRAELLLKGARE